jgi:hypothetical protein
VSAIWLPGTTGPVDDLIQRIQRRVAAFAEAHGLERAQVEVELFDGALLVLEEVHPEPGYGFLTLVPHPDDGEEPYELIIPVGSIRQLAIKPPEEPGGKFGFRAGD